MKKVNKKQYVLDIFQPNDYMHHSECMKCPVTPSLHFSQPVLGPKNTRFLGDGMWENEVTGEHNTIAVGLELGGVDGRVGGCSSL